MAKKRSGLANPCRVRGRTASSAEKNFKAKHPNRVVDKVNRLDNVKPVKGMNAYSVTHHESTRKIVYAGI